MIRVKLVEGSASADSKTYQITSYSPSRLSATSGINGWSPKNVSCYATRNRANLKVSYSFNGTWTKGINSIIGTTFTTSTISGSFYFTPVY